MSEQPINQPTAPGDPASGVQGGQDGQASKQPASNPYTVEDYATGFMMGLEDRGWTKLDRELEDDIRGEVESLWDKLDVDGLEARIAELEAAAEAAESALEFYCEPTGYRLLADPDDVDPPGIADEGATARDALKALRAALGKEDDRE